MATLRIDQKTYRIEDGKNLLEACLELGLNLPYFCWHPAMGSVGACRQCAVKQFKNDQDTRGKIMMACVTPATDGTRIEIEDEEAKTFRKSVIEWLMLNHPHDCPVCDEGGECHLQDMTCMTGHVYRRSRFKKRTFRNQDLGPFVNHEMNRCITCYRCVRFYRDYAGGRDFDAFATHDHVYFGRQQDGVLESEFSGNLVEVCPTGVFTDKTLKKHYTRKWDLQTAPGVCSQCGLGCNIIPGERYGTLRRIRNRYHSEINGYFLCDRGRYGYEFVNGEKRIRRSWSRSGGKASEEFRSLLRNRGRLARTIAIGSPRASLESGFALKSLVGPSNFYSGLSVQEAALVSRIADQMKSAAGRIASLQDIEHSDAILVLGEDIPNTAPRMALSIRQAARVAPMSLATRWKVPSWLDGPVRDLIQNEKSPIYIANPRATRIDDLAEEKFLAAPDDIARLGFAIANCIDPEAPSVTGISSVTRSLAMRIAEKLRSASRPAIISGSTAGSAAVIDAAANIATALSKTGRKPWLSFVLPECNTLGAHLLGGLHLEEAFERAFAGEVDTVIVSENDLFRRASRDDVLRFLKSVRQVIVLDSIATAMVPRADILLPAASFAEGSGTYVNSEGRAQRFFRVFGPEGEIRETWRWIRESEDLDDLLKALASEEEGVVRRAIDAAPSADYRIHGQRVPRQPHRYSGRTAMFADRSVFDPKPAEDRDSPLAFSMEGSELQPPAALVPRFWSPGWNSIQALNRFQSEIPGPLRDGPSGVRLIDPDGTATYSRAIPDAFEPSGREFRIVPFHHVFGSEETSALCPSLAKRIPRPYVAVSRADGDRLFAETGIRENDEVSLSVFPDRGFALKIEESLPAGLIGVPIGLPGMPYVAASDTTGILRRMERGAA